MISDTVEKNKLKMFLTVTSSILAGWNVFLISSFLLLILFSIILSKLGWTVKFGSFLFIVETSIALLLSLASGSFLGRKFYFILNKIGIIYHYIILFFLLLVTLLLFPGIFHFQA